MTDQQQSRVNDDAPYGSATADALINRFASPHERTVYECRLCAEVPKALAVGEVREHVIKAHATEYAREGERKGTAFVQRAGDFEKYAAMPSVDPTFGEFFADAGLTPAAPPPYLSESPTRYSCDECARDPATRLAHDDLKLMRLHVENEHPQVVTDESARRARESAGGRMAGGDRDEPAVAEPPYESMPTDKVYISVEGHGWYGCKLCQRDPAMLPSGAQDDPMYKRDLGEMRAHVLKRHTSEFAETLGMFSRDAVNGGGTHRTLAEAQRLAREITGFDPTRPTLAECEARDKVAEGNATAPGRNLLGYRTDDLNGATPYGVSFYDRRHIAPVGSSSEFECRVCASHKTVVRGSLGELRRHLIASHTPDITLRHVTAREGTTPGRDAGEFGAMVADSLLRENLNGYECKLCVTALTGFSREALDALRRHIVIAHSLAYEALAVQEVGGEGKVVPPAAPPPAFEISYAGRPLNSSEYVAAGGGEHVFDTPPLAAPSTTSTTHPDPAFEIDREAFFGDEVREAAARRAGELKLATSVHGESVNVNYVHELCGEQFDDVHDALAHECVAESPVPGDSLVLLRAYVTADAAERRKERTAMREFVSQVGAALTHVRESVDDGFEVLARATEALDRFERGQLDDERARRTRLKGSARA